MELVPPPERVTLPAGANLVQCFVCTALFYTQEENEKHLKLHRKADIIRAINEYSSRNHERHQQQQARPSSSSRPHQPHKPDYPPAGLLHHSNLHPQPVAPSHWLEPLPSEPAPQLAAASTPPPLHGTQLINPYSQQHGWTVFSGPEHHSPVYTDLDAGPSGAPANSSYPISPLDVSTHTVLEPDLPAAELLCTEESLHSSCPSPGGDSEPTVLRPAPEYHGQDFSVYSSEPAPYTPPQYGLAQGRCRSSADGDHAERRALAAPADYVSFKCIHCSREFSSAEDIHGHLTTVSEASHVCQACHQVCQNTWHLADHMAHHNSPRPFKCGVCSKEFRTQQMHRQHILQHIPAKIRDRVDSEMSGGSASSEPQDGAQWSHPQSKAEVLGEAGIPVSVLATVGTVPALSPPVSRPPPASVLKSPPSSRVASSSSFVAKSEAPSASATPKPVLEAKRKVHVCTTCGATFRFVTGLHRHTLTQHKQGKRPTRRICSCDHCGRIFHSYKQLRWHAEIHGEKPCTCTTCGRRFLHMSWLTRHIRSQHNPRFSGATTGNSAACPLCQKVYMKSSLRKHIRMMHQDLKPFQCGRCGRRFAAKCNLKTHVLAHLSFRDRPYKCSICRKAYTVERDLRKHMASHEGKKYPCKVCGRQFSHMPSMNVHLREHNGEKNHVCAYCGKRFARKAYLTGHLRIHTGERPHVCSICERSFASKSNYNAHMKSHARREPVNSEL